MKKSCLLIIVEVCKDSGALEVGVLQSPHVQWPSNFISVREGWLSPETKLELNLYSVYLEGGRRRRRMFEEFLGVHI